MPPEHAFCLWASPGRMLESAAPASVFLPIQCKKGQGR